VLVVPSGTLFGTESAATEDRERSVVAARS
jgi:hypothetical protein